MIMVLTGTAFSRGQSDPRPARDMGEALCSGPGDSGQSGAGQNPLPPEVSTKVASSKKIRVLTPSGELLVGKPVLHSGGIKGQSGGLSASIPWRDVRAIKLKKSNAGLGAGIGFAIGTGFAISMAAGLDASSGGYTRGILVFGGGAALVGALIGAAASGWDTVYIVPASQKPAPRISLAPAPRGGFAVSAAWSF
jgi:hypothetical protein